MNRTLLLILCDFLLLNILALTRWDAIEMSRPETQAPPVPQMPSEEDPVAAQNRDLVEMMQLALADEQSVREELAAARDQLAAALRAAQDGVQDREQRLQERERTLEEIAQERARLEEGLEQARAQMEEVSQDAAVRAAEAEEARRRIAQLQQDLIRQQEEAERRAQEVAEVRRREEEARSRIEDLTVTVRVAEEEKRMLRGTIDEVRQEVAIVRQEKEQIQQQAGVLAEGVGRLADRSGELTQEIRDHRPINANVLFNEFLENRVDMEFWAQRDTLFGPQTRQGEVRTVLVTDGENTYAITHVQATPFNPRETAPDWARFRGRVGPQAEGFPLEGLSFLSIDPRISVVQLDDAQVADLGTKVYPVALDPFRFPEAVLVNSAGRGYGEIAFRLDAATPRYVRMDTRFFQRLMGEFTPSTGDLVFSKTGELLGIMVNNEYCAIIDNFLPVAQLPTGDPLPRGAASTTLREIAERVNRLPTRLR